MTKFIHLSSRVFNRPLAIHEAKLHAIMAVLTPRFRGEARADDDEGGGGVEVEPSVRAKTMTLVMDGERWRVDAAMDQIMSPVSSIPVARIRVIEIDGSLMSRCHGMSGWSGLASYESIKAEINEASSDAAVDAILLRVDSPGGEVNGIKSLERVIRQARTVKPVWCSVDSIAFSAACWIATQCDRVIVTPDGQMGSVGVIALHFEASKWEQDAGIKYTAIYAGEHKNDLSPHEPLDKAAASMVQADVDEVYAEFCTSVADGRGMDAEAVRKTGAAIYRGQQCIDIGFADALGDFDEAVSLLAAEVAARRPEPLAQRASTSTAPVAADASAPSPMMAESNQGEATMADHSKKGEAVPEDEEMKKKANEGEDEEEEDMVPESAKSNKAASASEIITLCNENGLPGLAAKLVDKGLSIGDVAMRVLKARRDAEPVVESAPPASKATKAGMDAINRAAQKFTDAEPGMNKHQAVARALRANPEMYDRMERNRAIPQYSGESA